jgi:hypothetical protein
MDAGSTADLRNRRSPVRRGFAKPAVAIRSICVAHYASKRPISSDPFLTIQ